MQREREWHQVGELINPRSRELPPVATPPRGGSGLVVQRYGKTRWWAVYRDGELLVVAVYKKGAERIVRELQGGAEAGVKRNPFGPPKKYRFAKGMRVRMIGQQFQTGIPYGTEGVIVQRQGALGMGIYSDPERIMIWVTWDVPSTREEGYTKGMRTFAVFHWELEPVSAQVIPITRARKGNPDDFHDELGPWAYCHRPGCAHPGSLHDVPGAGCTVAGCECRAFVEGKGPKVRRTPVGKRRVRQRRSNPGKSICVCGHSGDGPHSQHEDTIAAGHGKCMFCACPKFTWKRYRRAGETDPEHPEYTRLMQRVRKKNARRSTTEVTKQRGRDATKPFEVWARKSDRAPWGFIKAFADYNAALALAEDMGERAFYAKVTGPVLES